MNDISKEEGEISDDDDVLVVGFSKIGEDHSSPSTRVCISSVPEVTITGVRPANAAAAASNRKGLVGRSRQGRRRKAAVGRPPVRSCYGLSASLNHARERLMRNSQSQIPTLMSLHVKYSGRANVSPLSTNNGALPSGIPSTLPSLPPNVDSGLKSKASMLMNFKPKELRAHVPFSDSFANSPASDLDDRDYVDMLLEYKEIQKKLEVINQEEGRLVEEERNKENLSQLDSKAATGSKSDAGDKLADEEDEEDDLEILELRRKCLESLASVTEDKLPEQRNSGAHRSRQRLASYHRNKSPVRHQPNSVGDLVFNLRPQNRWPPSPVRSHERPAKRRLTRSGRESKQRVQSPNSGEKFKKFMESLQPQLSDISERIKSKAARSLMRSGSLLSPSVEDNYDEVAMDLDSGCEETEESAAGIQKRCDDFSEQIKASSDLPGLGNAVTKLELPGQGGGKNVDPLMFAYSGVGGVSPGFSGLAAGDPRTINTVGLPLYLPGEGYLPGTVLCGSTQVPGMRDFLGQQVTLNTQFSKDLPGNAQLFYPPGRELTAAKASDSDEQFHPVPAGDAQTHIPSGKEATDGVSGLSDDDDDDDSEEALLRKLLLNDLAKKKSQQNDAEKSAPSEVVSCAKPSVVPLMELSTRLVVKDSLASTSHPINPPHRNLKNQNSQSFFSKTDSSSQKSTTSVPSSTAVAHFPIVPAVRTVSAGSVSFPEFNAASKTGTPPLKVTIPVPVKKIKTQVPMPQHKPVIISLSGDTDSDSDGGELFVNSNRTLTLMKPLQTTELSESLLGNLDNLLKEARQATELKKDQNIPKLNKPDVCEDLMVKVTSNSKLLNSGTPDGSQQQNSETKVAELHKSDEKVGEGTEKVVKVSGITQQKADLTRATTVVNSVVAPSPSTRVPSNLSGFGLETWLMDGRKVELKLLARKISQLEKEINSERSQLQLEEHQMKKFELEMTRKRGQYRQSLIRVDKLKEQLSATEKILKHNQEQIVVLGKKTQELRSQSVQRKTRLESLKKEMNEAGRRLCGGAPLSVSGSTLTPQKTLSMNTLDVKKQPGSADLATIGTADLKRSQSAQVLMSSKFLAAEKKHLEELARKFEQLIENHKKKQAAKIKTTQTVGPSGARKQNKKSIEHIKTEEKMIFGAGNELYRDMTVIVPKRRKSLLDESPTTTKPSFGKTRLGEQSLAIVTGQAKDCEKADPATSADDAKLAAIQSITEARVRLIRRVLGEHLSKCASDNEIIDVGNDRLKNSDPYLRFQPPVEQVPGIVEIPHKTSSHTAESCSCKPYRSVLMCFRSYRFCPYYRTKEGQTVHSSANKINVNQQLCHFDLMGKCNDDKCPWQHEEDYKASHKETLMDIASYVPSVAGLNKSARSDEYPRMMEQFVDQFVKENSKLTDAEQSLRLLIETYKNTGLTAPNYILTKPRKWKISSTRRAYVDLDNEKELPLVSVKDRNSSIFINDDDIISGVDVRYWMLETEEVEDIETAVADSPSNVQLWIKLAYKKMSDLKRKANAEETLAIGMHVLSRGLEVNQNSETLWRHYLHLFGKREDTSELANFYQMALNCAPSYHLYWKCLELKSSYSEKMDVCKAVRQFLCSPRCRDDRETKSHHLLEIILFQAGLSIETGRFKTGREIVESVIHSRVSVIWLNLTWMDRIIVWLVYIHLVEFRKLPVSLYDPASSFPGPVVNKVPFSLLRSNDPKPRSSSNYLKKLVDDALQSCGHSLVESATNAAWLCELYRLKLHLEEEENGLESSVKLCRETLEKFPHFEELWIHLIEKTMLSTSDQELVYKVITDALEQNPNSVRLHLTSISVFLSQGDNDKALEFSERCALSLFDVEAYDSAADPNLLFCKLLDQTLPCTYHPPPLRSGISGEWINNNRSDIWLCYCLLLDLQGAHDQALEAYQTAISTIKDGAALGTFCLRFLSRCYGALRCKLPWSSSSGVAISSAQRWSEFDGHVSQLLQILPSRFPFPHDPEQSWINFSVQNEIVDLYISCLSDDNIVLKSYERFLAMMPTNVVLVKRACDFMLKKEYTAMCNGVCSAAIVERPKARLLWNINLLLSHQDGKVSQMRRAFRAATSNLPFSQKLWKDFMLFEIAQRNSSGVRSIVERCRQLQINIEEALSAVLSASQNIPKPPRLSDKK